MRKLIAFACVCGLALGLLNPNTATAAPGSPSAVVQHFEDALLEVMKNGPTLGAQGRFEKLTPVVQAAFDVPFMTRMSIGLTWGRMSPDEKTRATSAFTRYITATYASNFSSYGGERFETLGEEKIRHGTIVRTRLVQSNNDRTALNYVLHDNDTAWQIRDIYLIGTISELATRRSEFTAILQRSGIEGLIGQLNKKADQLLG